MKVKLAEAKRTLATLTALKKAADVRKNAYLEMGEVPDLRQKNEAFE